MKNWLKYFFKGAKSSQKPFLPTIPQNKNHLSQAKQSENPLGQQKKIFHPLTNFFDFSKAKPLNITVIKIKNNINEKEKKIWWIEYWYSFRDNKLVKPFEKISYFLRVVMHVVKKLLLKNIHLEKIYNKLKKSYYNLISNEKIREYFVPGSLLLIFLFFLVAL